MDDIACVTKLSENDTKMTLVSALPGFDSQAEREGIIVLINWKQKVSVLFRGMRRPPTDSRGRSTKCSCLLF